MSGRTILAGMKTTRVLAFAAAFAALVLATGCGMKGPLVLPEADSAKNGSSQPTGGTSRPPAGEAEAAPVPPAEPRPAAARDE